MVEGLDKLNRKLTVTIPKRVQEATRKAMEKGAEETVQMMKRLVPVDSGALRDSIGWTWGDAPNGSFTIGMVGGREYGTMRITIYAGNDKVYWARFVEFGTRPHNSAKGGGTKAGKESYRTGRRTKLGIAPRMHPGAAAKPFFYPSWRAMRKRVKSRITREMRKAIKSESGG